MATNSDKSNLVRIRDNQRRSRARRREYLQELEQRLRVCELQGIEASTEIQQAARRAIDENRKLRLLLSQQGVSDDAIDTFLRSSGGRGQPSGQGSPPAESGSAAQALERLLLPRQPNHLDSSLTAPGALPEPLGQRSETSSVKSNTSEDDWRKPILRFAHPHEQSSAASHSPETTAPDFNNLHFLQAWDTASGCCTTEPDVTSIESLDLNSLAEAQYPKNSLPLSPPHPRLLLDRPTNAEVRGLDPNFSLHPTPGLHDHGYYNPLAFQSAPATGFTADYLPISTAAATIPTCKDLADVITSLEVVAPQGIGTLIPCSSAGNWETGAGNMDTALGRYTPTSTEYDMEALVRMLHP
ncbi:uncharacterized protein BCR38DRAFT_196037 [Pseudomassariella vexata]|uniref:BZIP domain-containing protein n=1 Tax=Pseudomassariella vexata TaxID=1141098 RepID=A0A1Y2E1Y9_9PEZI|nr:uncharacterized protein BCR38DRAFT_196037 [Pseudomassariella vexata]ORY65364.1 hypothetical protein BCR38DRAFT_196037 [Pseudomassariella vexata]